MLLGSIWKSATLYCMDYTSGPLGKGGQKGPPDPCHFPHSLLSSPKLSSKNSRRYSKKDTKNKCVYFNEVINDNENEAENEE